MGDFAFPVLYRDGDLLDDEYTDTVHQALGFPDAIVTGAFAVVFTFTLVTTFAVNQFVLLKYPMIALANKIA